MASLAHERTSSYITIFMVNTYIYRLVILTIPATLFSIPTKAHSFGRLTAKALRNFLDNFQAQTMSAGAIATVINGAVAVTVMNPAKLPEFPMKMQA
jgi:hypothetical protein